MKIKYFQMAKNMTLIQYDLSWKKFVYNKKINQFEFLFHYEFNANISFH